MIIVIPMAGAGQRFIDAGFVLPKPFILMDRKPIIRHVIDNLLGEWGVERAILIAREHHIKAYGLKKIVCDCRSPITIKGIPDLTAGAVNTVLAAKDIISAVNGELIIANSDQLILDDNFLVNGVEYFKKNHADAGAWCFLGYHPKWSYCEYAGGVITHVYEKRPVGCLANTGVYYWASGRKFIECAEKMISKNIRVNGEFYVAPVMNEAIEDRGLVLPYMVNNMVSLGTPEDYENYLSQRKR